MCHLLSVPARISMCIGCVECRVDSPFDCDQIELWIVILRQVLVFLWIFFCVCMRLEYYKNKIDMGIDWGFAYRIYNTGDLQEAPRTCQVWKVLHSALIHKSQWQQGATWSFHLLPSINNGDACPMGHASTTGDTQEVPRTSQALHKLCLPQNLVCHACSPLWTCPHPRWVPHLTLSPQQAFRLPGHLPVQQDGPAITSTLMCGLGRQPICSTHYLWVEMIVHALRSVQPPLGTLKRPQSLPGTT